jgi:hypothetical protein
LTPAVPSFLELGRKQTVFFTVDNVLYCEVLVSADSCRSILVGCYSTLVRLGKLIPIENLRQSEKEVAWQTAKNIAKGRLGKKAMIELVQALMALEYFLNL